MGDLRAWRRQFAGEIVGESAEILDALDTIRRVANTDCSILITGETGSGKELFARAAHRASNRRAKPFIPVNCAALPETLIEAELFGHVKGAFTGAMTARAGRFLSAQGGTLFLDEIGDLPLSAQAKLLRVLEERVVCPVGADRDIAIDVRIVAATHRNLEQMVAEGTFRADLYYRLSVVPLHLPALRDRGDDFDIVVDLTLIRMCERTGRDLMTLEPSARVAIRSYSWPGNVRELAHRIERAVLLARGTQIAEGDLSLPTSQTPIGVVRIIMVEGSGPIPKQEVLDDLTLDLRSALEAVERTLIDRALSKSNGNRTAAAALLGLNRTTLVEKLRKYVVA
jgi:sigma-54 dependent transcriptional regulator, flagellar regulatory protein